MKNFTKTGLDEMIDQDIESHRKCLENAEAAAKFHRSKIERLVTMKECAHQNADNHETVWMKCYDCGYVWYVGECE